MYQYKAVLKHNKKLIAEGHTVQEIEKLIVRFKREQKYGIHTNANNQIAIIHVLRDKIRGKWQEKIIKIV